MDHIGGHGIVAIFTNGDPEDSDAIVLLRADIDALLVVETTGVDYASKNGNGSENDTRITARRRLNLFDI